MIFLVAGLLAAVSRRCGIFFETNDDRTLTEILSGVLAPAGEIHTVHVSVGISFFLAKLYQRTTAVPWYGLLLIGIQAAVYILLFAGLWKMADSLLQKLEAVLLFLFLFLCGIGMLAQIQYTSTAALLAAAGWGVLLCGEGRNSRQRVGMFFLMELTACFLRSQAMLMMQPVGALCYGGLLLQHTLENRTLSSPKEKNRKQDKTSENNTNRRVFCRQLLCPVGAVVLAVVICLGLQAVSYGKLGGGVTAEEWNRYEKGNRAREELFDYGEKPLYEDVEEILNRYGVTRTQYQAFLYGTMMNREISTECLEELAAFSRTQRTPALSLGQAYLKQFSLLWEGEGYHQLNRVILLLWGVCLCVFLVRSIVKKSWYSFLPLSGLFLGRGLVWCYLIEKGRMPKRVTFPLLFFEILLLLLLLWKEAWQQKGRQQEKSRSIQRGIELLVLAVLLLQGFFCGREQYRYAAEQNRGQAVYFQGMEELKVYCGRFPQRQYYIEAAALSYYTGSALETAAYQDRNFMVTGGWYANSPAMEAKLAQYAEDREADVYLILYEDGNTLNHPAVVYFEEKFGTEAEKADSFQLSNGGWYTVYRYTVK